MTVWVYQQTTGELLADGEYVATGYSGHGDGVNNPAMQAVANVGPIPRGWYRCGAPHHHIRLGPVSIELSPIDHDCCGRSEFFVHGDNVRGDKSASKGCIIVGRTTRSMFELGDVLEVVE